MFIKVNEYTINTDQIRFIVHDHRGSITIVWGSGDQDLVLPEQEAVEFLKKLHTLDDSSLQA